MDHASIYAMTDEAYAAFLESGEPAEFAKTFIHTHTDMGSPKDAVLTVSQYVDLAKKYGAVAITISDHGTMYAVPNLSEACRKAGIKLVIGVEFYVCDDVEDKTVKKHTRLHLCAYAKDIIGYHVICRLVTDANKRMITVGKLNFPCISKAMLLNAMGPGTEGHDHVVLTSACVGGVLAGIGYANQGLKKNMEDAKKKAQEERNLMISIQSYEQAQERLEKEIEELTTRSKDKNEPELLKVKDALKERKAILRQCKSSIRSCSTKMTKIVGRYIEAADFESHVKKDEEHAENLASQVRDEASFDEFFRKEALWYDDLAGHGNWFIELQYHGIPEEKLYMPMLARIAEEYNIPLVAANDAHMEKPEDLELRKVVNALRFNTWAPPAIGDSELYLKTDQELYRALRHIVPHDTVLKAMKGRETLISMCDVELKKVPSYPVFTE